MSTSATIDQVGTQIQLNGEPVKLDLSGPGYVVTGKHDYPVAVDFLVGDEKFCLEQDWRLEHTALYEFVKDDDVEGYYVARDSVMLPADHPILQWLKPITA